MSPADQTETFSARLQAVNTRIREACERYGKDPAKVQLLAVSKTFPATAVKEALAAGMNAFGENYVQEGIEKIGQLRAHRQQITWHFIGPLQSNKSRDVAEHFDWMHSIDREKIAKRLSDQRPKEIAPLQVCIQ
ncbi:MAG: YggS family pyridoxal phosphate-dependent enzyme, partial [Burkholderiaceae bacterium]|nr:YggS family pyridoxal phosphate-dependent enzyme [Burkholderiaceae bacterium]